MSRQREFTEYRPKPELIKEIVAALKLADYKTVYMVRVFLDEWVNEVYPMSRTILKFRG